MLFRDLRYQISLSRRALSNSPELKATSDNRGSKIFRNSLIFVGGVVGIAYSSDLYSQLKATIKDPSQELRGRIVVKKFDDSLDDFRRSVNSATGTRNTIPFSKLIQLSLAKIELTKNQKEKISQLNASYRKDNQNAVSKIEAELNISNIDYIRKSSHFATSVLEKHGLRYRADVYPVEST
jgi:hypothetical protein